LNEDQIALVLEATNKLRIQQGQEFLPVLERVTEALASGETALDPPRRAPALGQLEELLHSALHLRPVRSGGFLGEGGQLGDLRGQLRRFTGGEDGVDGERLG